MLCRFPADGEEPLEAPLPRLEAISACLSTYEVAVSIALVKEILPNDRYRLVLANGFEVEGTVPAAARAFFNRVRVGDRIEVEVSPFDPSKVRCLAPAGTPPPRSDLPGPGRGPSST